VGLTTAHDFAPYAQTDRGKAALQLMGFWRPGITTAPTPCSCARPAVMMTDGAKDRETRATCDYDGGRSAIIDGILDGRG